MEDAEGFPGRVQEHVAPAVPGKLQPLLDRRIFERVGDERDAVEDPFHKYLKELGDELE